MINMTNEDDLQMRIADCGFRIGHRFVAYPLFRRAVLIDEAIIASSSSASLRSSRVWCSLIGFGSISMSIQYIVSSHSSSKIPNFAMKSARERAQVAAQ